MKKKSKVVVLSLSDEKLKKIGNIISNDSSRKIVEYLTAKDATATELSVQLNIPLPTVHYNIQQLMESGLVSADEFHYSKKGKEINHYKLTHPYILISPTDVNGLRHKLASILPVALILAASTAAVHIAGRWILSSAGRPELMKSADIAQEAAAQNIASSALSQAPAAAGVGIPAAVWFISGVFLGLIGYALWSYWRKE